MPVTRPFPGELAEGRAWYAHGDGIAVHQHSRGQLLYAAVGVLLISVGGGTWMVPANRIAWTPPGWEHSHRVYGATEVRILQLPARLCSALPGRPAVFAANSLLREVVVALTDGRPMPPAPRARLRQVVADQLTDIPGEPLYLPEATDDRLRAATALLHADPADQSTLADLGRTVGASERTLSRLFNTELGMGFYQWRTLLRVQHALVRLLDGQPVTETAIGLGWANPSSFIEAFNAIVGQTPGRYQAEARRTGS